MPPVRWKALVYVTTLMLLPLLKIADAQHMHDAISMSADGWRPIVGSRRQPPAFESDIRIKQHKNPSQISGIHIVKSENSIAISSTASPNENKTKSREPQNDINNSIHGRTIYHLNQGDKIPPHTKLTPPPGYHTLPTGTHRPQIPLNGVTVGRPSQFGIKKPLIKPTSSPHFSQKRKPMRVQVGAHSVRNEVYVQPSNSGGFPFIKQGPSNVKTREAQGLGLPGTNHYTVNQPNSHIEFTNRFAPPAVNSNVFEQYKSNPVTYIFSNPTQFKTQNDDYTRNLVPPPPQRLPQEQNNDNSKLVPNLKDNVVVPSISEPVIRLNDFGFRQAAQFGLKPPQFQDNLVAQIPISFEQGFAFQKQFKPKPQAVDVQVTKEKLKVYHNNHLGNFNQRLPEYTDYDFHAINNPPNNLPKQQTYEVTEGKWIDNPNPYIFSFPQSQQLLPQRIKPIGTARPTLIAEPLVELNLPPFLPTPFRPEGTVASPSQTEVSTVFSLVSSKMNKYKNEALTSHPLFFDVKEVSTHYPVLGIPEYAPEAQTDTPQSMNEHEDISNEITTLKEEVTTQRPKTRRRRPQPRRTTTSTTTTTTKEPVTENLSYELQKDNYNSEMSVETERPLRRQRPRPNRFRTGSSFENDERIIRYRTTTPSTDSDEISNEKRIRGRHRYRQRGNAENSESRHPALRKRLRPTTTEMPTNHKPMETEAPFISSEANVVLGETQGLFETQSPQLQQITDEDVNSKLNRFEYKQVPIRYNQQNQVQEENAPQYETTAVNNEMSGLKLTIEEVTQRTQPIVTTIAEETTMVNVNSPENEVDYSTPSSTLDQHSVVDNVPMAAATTIPSTTTTETQTTRTTRTRGRPNKYNAASRPRFSVKDYRQRLNQYTSTTPSTTTDFSRISEEPKLRFPSRIRTRLTTTTTASTQQTYPQEDDDTAEPGIRRRFKPKEPRHSSTTESSDVNIITETNIKSVNTRLRPFGRHRSTTESSVPNTKVSIRPNLFNSARRRPPLSMRNKLSNKSKNLTEETTLANDAETTEVITTQVTESTAPVELNTEFISINKNIEGNTEAPEPTTIKISEDDYSQRVSDLTSSFKNEYETPGLFKSVSPNTRRIPNYFTISTDDPILPIEAFFPNLKDKDKEKE